MKNRNLNTIREMALIDGKEEAKLKIKVSRKLVNRKDELSTFEYSILSKFLEKYEIEELDETDKVKYYNHYFQKAYDEEIDNYLNSKIIKKDKVLVRR